MASYDFSSKAADEYFSEKNHPMSAAWKACAPKQREAFVAQAVRDYCSFTQCDVREMEARTGLVPPRMDYAVFERALFLMLNSGATSDGEVSGPKWLGKQMDANEETPKKRERSAEEQRWWPIKIRVILE